MKLKILVESSTRLQAHPQPKSCSGNLRFVNAKFVTE